MRVISSWKVTLLFCCLPLAASLVSSSAFPFLEDYSWLVPTACLCFMTSGKLLQDKGVSFSCRGFQDWQCVGQKKQPVDVHCWSLWPWSCCRKFHNNGVSVCVLSGAVYHHSQCTGNHPWTAAWSHGDDWCVWLCGWGKTQHRKGKPSVTFPVIPHVQLSPDITLCGCLGSKHQLTITNKSHFQLVCESVLLTVLILYMMRMARHRMARCLMVLSGRCTWLCESDVCLMARRLVVLSSRCAWFVWKLCVFNGKMVDGCAWQLYLVCVKAVCV